MQYQLPGWHVADVLDLAQSQTSMPGWHVLDLAQSQTSMIGRVESCSAILRCVLHPSHRMPSHMSLVAATTPPFLYITQFTMSHATMGSDQLGSESPTCAHYGAPCFRQASIIYVATFAVTLHSIQSSHTFGPLASEINTRAVDLICGRFKHGKKGTSTTCSTCVKLVCAMLPARQQRVVVPWVWPALPLPASPLTLRLLVSCRTRGWVFCCS